MPKPSLLLIALLAGNLHIAPTQAQEPDTTRAGNEKVAEIMRTFGGRGVMADDSAPTPATEAVQQFDVRKGFQLEVAVSEPIVAQPLFVSWDSRGRMWVVQYRQYQYPAGLKVIRFDQHLRAVFDKVPDPPPMGTPGLDKITVHEDTNGDGSYDKHKEVISDLNIATSVQVGNGGIWVLNPPYLLRYPDANRDDVPDGDPEVHLSGFGIQDTHSVANSLLWGPDGWLYGCNGSTTVGDVSSAVTKGVRFQGQCVWRYHPETRIFEIYAEGGGNTFSLDIDSKGRVFTGTNGGNTRGWYFPQGSYSAKNWGKHGPLTNPYAFGFFPPMKFEGDGRRFPQAFCIYEGGAYPEGFDGSIIAPNALHNLVWHSQRLPDGSTYRTIDQPNLLTTGDRWFRPVYSGVGPDGAVYIADWYDTRLSHVSPVDNWHKESGRVYRVVPEGGLAGYGEGDLHERKTDDLISCLRHPNKWVRQRATLELGWRGDKTAVNKLARMVDQGSLEALWTLNLLQELTDDRAATWLQNPNADIRRWVIRLLGDQHRAHESLIATARSESDVQVRSQLAATAKRIDAQIALPIIRALIANDSDTSDPQMPLMVWWALEGHASAWAEIKPMLTDSEIWSLPLFRDHIASRLMQRYAASGSTTELQHCAELLKLAPAEADRDRLMTGLNRAFQGQSLPQLPPSLETALNTYQARLGDSGLVLGMRQGQPDAGEKAIALLKNRSADLGVQLEIAKTLGEVKYPAAVPTLLRLATGQYTGEPALQRVAMRSLAQYDDASIPKTLVSAFGGRVSGEHGLRATACRTLASRPAWANVLLAELNAWRLRRDQIPPDVVQQLRSYEDTEIATRVEQAFGKAIDSAPEKIAEIKRLREILTADSGNHEKGKAHFTKRCGNCHQLFGEGKKVGPPLDGYERGNLTFWLNSIVEPSLEIREGFQSYLILTKDGRVLNGMIAAQDPKTVTLRNADNQLSVISRDDIESLKAIRTSLMPTDVLKDMTPGELRNLFAYLSLGAKK